jgi:RNA polymerase sigma-70 factor, ECF subfamily
LSADGTESLPEGMAAMIGSAQSTPRMNASMHHEIPHSSRNHGVKHVSAAPEMEIITAAQAGSTAAFDELQRLYSSRLFSVILRITKNREDAEDALQDTFMRAYVALGCFERRSSVYSWLTRIAINSALMILRRRRSRPEALPISPLEEGDGYPPLEIRDTAPNPEQLFALRQQNNFLLHAIGKLEPSLRGAIEIQLAGECSMKDIADSLNISVAAVKARLYRARVRLAKGISLHTRAKQRMPPNLTGKREPIGFQNRQQPCTTCGHSGFAIAIS